MYDKPKNFTFFKSTIIQKSYFLDFQYMVGLL